MYKRILTDMKITKNLEVAFSLVAVLSVIAVVLETVPELNKLSSLFRIVEVGCLGVFTAEYLLRIRATKKPMMYIFSVWGLIDLLAIIPSVLSVANLSFLKAGRSLRLVRLLRMMRLAKLAHNIDDKSAEQAEKHILSIYVSTMLIATLITGTLLYSVANGAQAYESIPLSMIQALKLLIGGIGYAPVTGTLAELVVIFTRLVGLALFGLLISIIGATLNKLLFGKR
jgi:voltage-gated potassium channel